MKKFSELNIFEKNKLFVYENLEIKEETIIGMKIQRIGLEGILVLDLTTKNGWNYPICIGEIENDICYFKDNENGKVCISTSIDRLLLEMEEC